MLKIWKVGQFILSLGIIIKDMRVKRNSQQQIVDFLINHPCKTESEIQEWIWGYYRSESNESNKKYADILRRALYSGKIKRARLKYKFKGETRYYWRYFVNPDFLLLTEFASDYKCKLEPMLREWKACKSNYNNDITLYIKDLEYTGDFEIFQ